MRGWCYPGEKGRVLMGSAFVINQGEINKPRINSSITSLDKLKLFDDT